MTRPPIYGRMSYNRELKGKNVIDAEGFRHGVGIIITNNEQKVFWAKRIGQDAWQFPQGGLHDDETPEQGMYRELYEETGLKPEDVQIVMETKDWLYYRLPRRLIRMHQKPLCIGQKQKWFLLRLVGSEGNINFATTNSPEFDGWRWVDYWYPLKQVIRFKRKVYQRALKELSMKAEQQQQGTRHRLFGRRRRGF